MSPADQWRYNVYVQLLYTVYNYETYALYVQEEHSRRRLES